MIIQGHEVIFEEEGHQYYVDGSPVPSVTQFIKQVMTGDKYEGVSDSVLRQAAERGTRLHNAIEVYEQDGLESNEIQEFRDYLFLKKRFKWETLESEKMVLLYLPQIDKVLAGRFDQLQMQGGLLTIADIKNTSALDKDYLALQLNLYKLAYEQSYGKQIYQLKGIWLYGGKRKYVDIPTNPGLTMDILERGTY